MGDEDERLPAWVHSGAMKAVDGNDIDVRGELGREGCDFRGFAGRLAADYRTVFCCCAVVSTLEWSVSRPRPRSPDSEKTG